MSDFELRLSLDIDPDECLSITERAARARAGTAPRELPFHELMALDALLDSLLGDLDEPQFGPAKARIADRYLAGEPLHQAVSQAEREARAAGNPFRVDMRSIEHARRQAESFSAAPASRLTSHDDA